MSATACAVSCVVSRWWRFDLRQAFTPRRRLRRPRPRLHPRLHTPRRSNPNLGGPRAVEWNMEWSRAESVESCGELVDSAGGTTEQHHHAALRGCRHLFTSQAQAAAARQPCHAVPGAWCRGGACQGACVARGRQLRAQPTDASRSRRRSYRRYGCLPWPAASLWAPASRRSAARIRQFLTPPAGGCNSPALAGPTPTPGPATTTATSTLGRT